MDVVFAEPWLSCRGRCSSGKDNHARKELGADDTERRAGGWGAPER